MPFIKNIHCNFSHCKNIKGGMPNFVESVLCRDLGLLLLFVWFYDGPNWPPTLCTKFEVDTFSHCINITGKTPNFGSSPSLGPRPLFLLGGILWWALANLSCTPNFKFLASAVAEILKDPKILGSSLSPGPRLLFFWCNFMISLGKLILNIKFEVNSFSRCRNIKGEAPHFGELPYPIFRLVGFGDGPWQTPAVCEIWLQIKPNLDFNLIFDASESETTCMLEIR